MKCPLTKEWFIHISLHLLFLPLKYRPFFRFHIVTWWIRKTSPNVWIPKDVEKKFENEEEMQINKTLSVLLLLFCLLNILRSLNFIRIFAPLALPLCLSVCLCVRSVRWNFFPGIRHLNEAIKLIRTTLYWVYAIFDRCQTKQIERVFGFLSFSFRLPVFSKRKQLLAQVFSLRLHATNLCSLAKVAFFFFPSEKTNGTNISTKQTKKMWKREKWGKQQNWYEICNFSNRFSSLSLWNVAMKVCRCVLLWLRHAIQPKWERQKHEY